MLRSGFECLFSTTLLRGTGTGTADDLHDNVLNVCVPPMWLASAGLKAGGL